MDSKLREIVNEALVALIEDLVDRFEVDNVIINKEMGEKLAKVEDILVDVIGKMVV